MHADELADLLRWCAALSTHPAELAGSVVLAAGQRWSGLVDSLADLRELTVRTFLATSQTQDPLPREGLERVPEELRTVIAAYDQLPKLQRAVLMLDYLDRITYSEIAGIVDRSVGRVHIELDRARDTLGADPYSVRAAMEVTTWHLPTPIEVSRAFQRQAQTRARRRYRIGLVSIVAGMVLVSLLTISAVHRPYAIPRQPGVWAFSHTVRPLSGWSVQSRTVDRDWEMTTLTANFPESGRCSVAVGATGASWTRALPRNPTRVWVGARPAWYADAVWPNGGGAMLWWEYADAALVIIECGNLTVPREVLPKLASHVVLGTEPILLPYRVGSAPRAYQVTSVANGLVSHSTVAYLTRDDYPEGIVQISIRYPAGLPMYAVNYSSVVSRYTSGRHAAVCRPFGDSHICVRGELLTPGRIDITDQRGALAVLDQVASNLELARSATDLSSWFDARDALPS
jgi:hypothetical protein